MLGLKRIPLRFIESKSFNKKYSTLCFRKIILRDVINYYHYPGVEDIDKIGYKILKKFEELLVKDLIENEAEYQFTNIKLFPLTLKIRVNKQKKFYVKLHGPLEIRKKLYHHTYPLKFVSKRKMYYLPYIIKLNVPHKKIKELTINKFITTKSYIHG